MDKPAQISLDSYQPPRLFQLEGGPLHTGSTWCDWNFWNMALYDFTRDANIGDELILECVEVWDGCLRMGPGGPVGKVERTLNNARLRRVQ